MSDDLLHLYDRASGWTAEKVAGATAKLDAPTPCDGWDVRTLLNHMLDTQRYFLAAAHGEHAAPPAPVPPEIVSDDPLVDFQEGRSAILHAYAQPGVVDATGPSLGIAFADQLLHGWDLARATEQDATMPDGLAEAAYECIHGRFTAEQRHGLFAPEVEIGRRASAQDRLLAYSGRDPRAQP
jgi:uncharacterized protein (TIGR03086 family)